MCVSYTSLQAVCNLVHHQCSACEMCSWWLGECGHPPPPPLIGSLHWCQVSSAPWSSSWWSPTFALFCWRWWWSILIMALISFYNSRWVLFFLEDASHYKQNHFQWWVGVDLLIDWTMSRKKLKHYVLWKRSARGGQVLGPWYTGVCSMQRSSNISTHTTSNIKGGGGTFDYCYRAVWSWLTIYLFNQGLERLPTIHF